MIKLHIHWWKPYQPDFYVLPRFEIFQCRCGHFQLREWIGTFPTKQEYDELWKIKAAITDYTDFMKQMGHYMVQSLKATDNVENN